MKKYLVSLLLVFFAYTSTNAQNHEVLPSIMVVPRVKANQDLRKLVDNSPTIRAGMASIKDGFDLFGYTTKDFETVLKRAMTDPKVWEYSREDFKKKLFRTISTDIIVEMDIVYIKSNAGNSVRAILEANEVSTANSLASKTCESNMFYTNDIASLTLSAMKQSGDGESSCFDDFMKEIILKWNKQYEDGKIVVIDFSFDKNSKMTMDSKLASKDNERLKFLIEDWLNDTSYNNYIKISQVTESNIYVEEYKYAYTQTARNIERNLYRFFDKLEVAVKIVNNGNSIYVKIL